MTSLDIILSLGPWILDKISPSLASKIFPPIKIAPKILKLGSGDWNGESYFSILNKQNTVLYDIYISIDVNNSMPESYVINTDGIEEIDSKNLSKNVITNTKLIRFNIVSEDNQKSFILLKLSRLEEKEKMKFKINGSSDKYIKIKALEWSKNQTNILSHQADNKIAINFRIPANLFQKKNMGFILKSMSLFLKRK